MSVREPVGGITAGRPNAARIYDCLPGGKDYGEVDRQTAERLVELVPDASVACYDNRQFLGRAVRYLVSSTRPPVRQIVDIGTGRRHAPTCLLAVKSPHRDHGPPQAV